MKMKNRLPTPLAEIGTSVRLLAAALLLLGAGSLHAQDSFHKLYKPATARAQNIRSMTVELRSVPEGADTNKIAEAEADYWERYGFDESGRTDFYEATDINIRRQGTPGPHIISKYEYSDDGRVSHRHDSTAFGRNSVWHYRCDSLGRPLKDEHMLPDREQVSAERTYLYDAKGRLERLKARRDRSAEGMADACDWVFFVHDSHSFNATSLSPMDMARCNCSLQYMDQEGRKAREVLYDASGNIRHTLLYNYDRTGKPIRLEMRDGSGTQLRAWVDVVYGRGGLVVIDARAANLPQDFTLGRLGMMAQSFVVENWAGWRLLTELRVRIAGRETSRYSFSYDIRN